jgi:hypothetical protein
MIQRHPEDYVLSGFVTGLWFLVCLGLVILAVWLSGCGEGGSYSVAQTGAPAPTQRSGRLDYTQWCGANCVCMDTMTWTCGELSATWQPPTPGFPYQDPRTPLPTSVNLLCETPGP